MALVNVISSPGNSNCGSLSLYLIILWKQSDTTILEYLSESSQNNMEIKLNHLKSPLENFKVKTESGWGFLKLILQRKHQTDIKFQT